MVRGVMLAMRMAGVDRLEVSESRLAEEMGLIDRQKLMLTRTDDLLTGKVVFTLAEVDEATRLRELAAKTLAEADALDGGAS